MLFRSNKADINAKTTAEGWTPLHSAAAFGHLDVVRLLLAHKAEIDAKEISGMTPLHHAAITGHKDVAALLLAKRAKVDVRDNYGMTPLHRAAQQGHQDVAAVLLANKAEVNAQGENGWTPLRLTRDGPPAVVYRNEEVAEYLRQHGGHE